MCFFVGGVDVGAFPPGPRLTVVGGRGDTGVAGGGAVPGARNLVPGNGIICEQ